MAPFDKNSIILRIEEFREYSGISKSTLASSIGMEQTTLNNQLIGKRGLSLDTIVALLAAFPDLSSEWLLRDRGNMFLTKYDGSFEADNLKLSERILKLTSVIESLQEMIDMKNKVISELSERNKLLETK